MLCHHPGAHHRADTEKHAQGEEGQLTDAIRVK
jgi:hypothetical protein